MNEHESFESGLQRMKPAPVPDELLARLRAAEPARQLLEPVSVAGIGVDLWRSIFRWLAPVAACAVIGVIGWRVAWPTPPRPTEPHRALAVVPLLRADAVSIDRELTASFDAVARLPDGESVRFRCREWMDQVVWHDSARGVTVEQRAPRLEIVPVRFETY